jgi:predicted RNA binding protein YcfA (HicA-like mRNA interferase family)
MTGSRRSRPAKSCVRCNEQALSLYALSGSHHRLVHPDDPSRATTVSVHAGKTLKRGTVHGIIKQAGLTVEEFRAFL